MRATPRPETLRRLQAAAAVAVVAACAALFARDAFWSPRAPYLVPDERAEWIQAPEPVSSEAKRPRPDPTRFETVFRVAPGEAPTLLLRTVGEARVTLNGDVVPGAEALPSSPKRVLRIPIRSGLREGENTLSVSVRRPLGPALLWAAAEDGGAGGLASRAGWRVGRGAAADEAAVVADDTRPLPEARALPSAAAEIRSRAPALAGVLAACTLAAALALRSATDPVVAARWAVAAPRIALAAVLGLWALVFVRNALDVPLLAGFDAGGHWEYVQFLVTRRSVPLATDGWSLYHPPLFYLAPAALIAGFGPVEQGSLLAALVRLLTFAGGVVVVLASAAFARRVHRGDPRAQVFAILLAGGMPMTLYVSVYFSNESWSAGLLALALAMAARIFDEKPPRAASLALLGLLFGAALLTKYTAVVVVPVILLFVGARLALDPRIPLARAASLLAVALLVPALVAGWFYVRNVVSLGQVLPSNWGELEVASGQWWQQPGFHTARWYLRFGESVTHPWFAGFVGFWDAFYSTMWGDGYNAGRTFLRDRLPQWDHGVMAATYLLALPASALLALGVLRGAWRSLVDPRTARRLGLALLATLAFVLVAALATVSLRYPYYGQVKAFYVLPIAVPLAVLGAEGFAACDALLARARSVAPRALFHGASATLFAAVAWTYAS